MRRPAPSHGGIRGIADTGGPVAEALDLLRALVCREVEPYRVTVDVSAEAVSLDDLRRAFNAISRPPYDGWLGADAAAFRAFFRLEARDASDAEARAQVIASDALAGSRRPFEWELRAVHARPL